MHELRTWCTDREREDVERVSARARDDVPRVSQWRAIKRNTLMKHNGLLYVYVRREHPSNNRNVFQQVVMSTPSMWYVSVFWRKNKHGKQGSQQSCAREGHRLQTREAAGGKQGVERERNREIEEGEGKARGERKCCCITQF